MADRHTDPGLTVRPPADVKADAKDILKERGLGVRGFIVACLTALIADPDGFLKQLQGHWPAVKPLGRPRKQPER